MKIQYLERRVAKEPWKSFILVDVVPLTLEQRDSTAADSFFNGIFLLFGSKFQFYFPFTIRKFKIHIAYIVLTFFMLQIFFLSIFFPIDLRAAPRFTLNSLGDVK